MIPPHHVLRAEIPAMAEVLRDAFLDDPVFTWMVPDAEARRGGLVQFMGASVDLSMRRGHAYSTDDGQAVALWSPPEIELYDGPGMEPIEDFFRDVIADRADLVLTSMLELNALHPPEPHFYLGVIGTRPSAQGKGHGAALLKTVLDRCDATGTGAYLESSSIRNVPFYERHGFRVTSEFTFPEGPIMRPMWRAPRPPA